MSIYRIDIDNTICKTDGDDYENAKPYKERIAIINKLYDEGNTIIYETARGQQTGKGYETLTRQQLKEWGAKFHTVTWKNYADHYVEDHNLSINELFKL